MNWTTIRLSKEIRELLKSKGLKGETYDRTLNRLLNCLSAPATNKHPAAPQTSGFPNPPPADGSGKIECPKCSGPIEPHWPRHFKCGWNKRLENLEEGERNFIEAWQRYKSPAVRAKASIEFGPERVDELIAMGTEGAPDTVISTDL